MSRGSPFLFLFIWLLNSCSEVTKPPTPPPGSGTIGTQGGTVSLPGGPTITVPPGAINGTVSFQLAESAHVAPHYTLLAALGYNLEISITDPASTFAESESLRVDV